MSDVDERWLANQDKFELHQLQKSSLLRIADGRAEPTDYLAAYPALLQEGFEVESQSCPQLPVPTTILAQVAKGKLGEILDTIAAFKKLDRRPLSVEFWQHAINYVNMKVARAQDSQAVTIVQPDLAELINSKKTTELQDIELEVKANSSKNVNNQEFWDGVVELIQQRRAELFFDNVHDQINMLVSHRIEIPMTHQPSPFRVLVLSKMSENEQLFEAVKEVDGLEYIARAIVGTTANFQAHSHTEPHLSNYVQGYKFSIYYPRLADSQTVPKYILKKNHDGTCELKFTAQGHPDLNFRILDEPWEKSQYGADRYQSTFERGVLHLEFRLKFYYYKN